MKVLFVCLGNICRSPAAEAILRKIANDQGVQDLTIDSAGTAAYHIGKSPDSRAKKKGAQHGYDLSALKARQVRVSDFHDFDLILAMDRENLANLKSLRPQGSQARLELASAFSSLTFYDVPDPYYGGDDGFEQVIQLCESVSVGVLGWCKEIERNA